MCAYVYDIARHQGQYTLNKKSSCACDSTDVHTLLQSLESMARSAGEASWWVEELATVVSEETV